jgi:hypothetical protein
MYFLVCIMFRSKQLQEGEVASTSAHVHIAVAN